MYSIQFGSRAGFIDATNAEAVFHAIRENERFVTVSIDIASDGEQPHEVTLNVDHIVALIKHRPKDAGFAVAPSDCDGAARTRLTVVS
jgi:hypothetical protein